MAKNKKSEKRKNISFVSDDAFRSAFGYAQDTASSISFRKSLAEKIGDWLYFSIWQEVLDARDWLRNIGSNIIVLKSVKRGQYAEFDTKMRAAVSELFLGFMDTLRKESIVEISESNFPDLANMLKAEEWFRNGSKKLQDQICKALDRYDKEIDIENMNHHHVSLSSSKPMREYVRLEKKFTEEDLHWLSVVIRNINYYWS